MRTDAAHRSWDRHSFAAFYDEAMPQVYRYLLRGCAGSTSSAEDLTQEAFADAVKEINRGNGDVVSIAWLITVARHRLIDHYRRAEREERKLRLVAQSTEPEVEELRLDDLDSASAMQLLNGLSSAQRAALVLRYLDDLPVAGVAEALGKSVHATESLLVRARAAMSRMMQELDDA